MESGFQAQSLPSDFRAELVLSDQPAQTFSEWFLPQVSQVKLNWGGWLKSV